MYFVLYLEILGCDSILINSMVSSIVVTVYRSICRC